MVLTSSPTEPIGFWGKAMLEQHLHSSQKPRGVLQSLLGEEIGERKRSDVSPTACGVRAVCRGAAAMTEEQTGISSRGLNGSSFNYSWRGCRERRDGLLPTPHSPVISMGLHPWAPPAPLAPLGASCRGGGWEHGCLFCLEVTIVLLFLHGILLGGGRGSEGAGGRLGISDHNAARNFLCHN